jgi:hypothetical protein
MRKTVQLPSVLPITRRTNVGVGLERMVALSSLLHPEKTHAQIRRESGIFEDEEDLDLANMRYLFEVRRLFTGTWGAGAELLFRALIRALDLQQHESVLVRWAESKPGRKQERELAERIWQLKAEKKTVPQIRAILESEGIYKSREAVAAYLKTRRKKRTRS